MVSLVSLIKTLITRASLSSSEHFEVLVKHRVSNHKVVMVVTVNS